jgi:hypothetical protein
MNQVELSPLEMRLIVQSLSHCLGSCQEKSKAGGPCEDCGSAKDLLARFEKLAIEPKKA